MVDSRTVVFVFISTLIFRGKISKFLCDAVHYTSYMEKCNFEEARNLSRFNTSSVFKHNKVHGGFFTVNKQYNINLYSLLIKSSKNWRNAPLIVWIQGQPACTALYAVFAQNGPYRVTANFSLIKNEYAWTNEFNVLYLDNMIFTGYSYAQNTSNAIFFINNMGSYLYEALFQFYQVFSNLAANDLYLAGEMYAGKYLLLLGDAIHKCNPISHVKMRLQGFYIGSGFVDPENMMGYSSLMYQIGVITYSNMIEMQNMEESIRREIRSMRYGNARQQFQSMLIEMEKVGLSYPMMDFTRPNVNFSVVVFDYLNGTEFRDALGLHDLNFYSYTTSKKLKINAEYTLRTLLEEKILITAKKLLPKLLNHYRFMYYAGQFDLLVPFVNVVNFIRMLEWKGADIYYARQSRRCKLIFDDQLAGYYRNILNLTELLVRNASQMVDVSTPKWGLNIIRKFINNDFKCISVELESSPIQSEKEN